MTELETILKITDRYIWEIAGLAIGIGAGVIACYFTESHLRKENDASPYTTADSAQTIHARATIERYFDHKTLH